jgi:hypothetical protein
MGRSRRRHGAHAYAPAGAPASAAPTPGGWREKHEAVGPLSTDRSFQEFSGGGCPCSRCGIVQGRSEPVKAVCGRRATAPVELRGARTREDGLD